MFLISVPMIIIIFGLAVFFIMKNRVVLALLIVGPFIYVLIHILSLPNEAYDIASGRDTFGHFLYLSVYYFFLGAAALALDISKSKKKRQE